MDIKQLFTGIFERSKGIIIHPREEWKKIKDEGVPMNQLVRVFLLPLLILSTVAAVLGKILEKVHVGFDGGMLLTEGLREFFGYFLSIYACIYAVNEIVKSFGGERNLASSANLVIYSFVPSILVSMVIGLVPSLYALGIFSLYSLYLFYIGYSEFFDIPTHKHVGFLITTILILILIFALVNYSLKHLFIAFT